MPGLLVLGLLLVAAGCMSLYLGSPHQRWLRRPWPARTALCAGGALLAAGLAALCSALHAVAAVYVFLTWAMLLLALLPYAGAYLSRHRAP